MLTVASMMREMCQPKFDLDNGKCCRITGYAGFPGFSLITTPVTPRFLKFFLVPIQYRNKHFRCKGLIRSAHTTGKEPIQLLNSLKILVWELSIKVVRFHQNYKNEILLFSTSSSETFTQIGTEMLKESC